MREIFKMDGKLMALRYGINVTCDTDDGSYEGAVMNYEARDEKLKYLVIGTGSQKRLIFGKRIKKLKINK